MSAEFKKILAKIILTPCSYIFKSIVVFRNFLFNTGVLKQREFSVPVVAVGNLAVGGTGKTPHTEYIVSRLCMHYKMAVLSRGYKRKTRGFVMATSNLSTYDLGDEPYQIYRKFGSCIDVAVCESRVKGIENLLEINPDINMIVLDDAFQHRYVKPKVSVVLTEYRKLPCDDKMLPLGELREPQEGLSRADIVVVTKCPSDIKPIDINVVKKKLNLAKWQKVFFSTYKYKDIAPVFSGETSYVPDLNWLGASDTILVVTGIANPVPMVKYLKRFNAKVKVIHFSDHHNYSREDLNFIQKTFEYLPGERKFIVTTEKDAVRIINNAYFPHNLRKHMFYLPIEVEFLPGEDDFINTIMTKMSNDNLMK